MPAKEPSRLKLPQVTICAADSAYIELTARALTKSMEFCAFGDAILFSDRPADGPFRHIAIPHLGSIADYSNFCLSTLPRMIETTYVLVIQWDGYVVNPAAWHRNYLSYDYVGAVWPDKPSGRNVGNGGFSLRSSRLLKALRTLPPVPHLPEDVTICEFHRSHLEKDFGIRFADERLANRFSYEWEIKDSFGFHGFHNVWRYLTDAEMLEVVDRVWNKAFGHWKSIWLIADIFDGGRKELAQELYGRLRAVVGTGDLMNRVEHSDLAQGWRLKWKQPTPTDVILTTLEQRHQAAGRI